MRSQRRSLDMRRPAIVLLGGLDAKKGQNVTQGAKGGKGRSTAAPAPPSGLSSQAKAFATSARRALGTSNATRLLGFALESIDEGRAALRLKAGTRHKQLHGVVHGGILAAFADTAGAMAAYTMAPTGTAIATIEMKINYLEPVPAGRVRQRRRCCGRGGILLCASATFLVRQESWRRRR